MKTLYEIRFIKIWSFSFEHSYVLNALKLKSLQVHQGYENYIRLYSVLSNLKLFWNCWTQFQTHDNEQCIRNWLISIMLTKTISGMKQNNYVSIICLCDVFVVFFEIITVSGKAIFSGNAEINNLCWKKNLQFNTIVAKGLVGRFCI